MRAPAAAALLAGVALLAGCGRDDDEGSTSTAEVDDIPQAAQAAGEAHGSDWSYTGDTGPEFWADLNPEYKACSDSERQSPIDLTGATPGKVPAIERDYRASGGTEENNGYEVAVELDDGGQVETLDKKYKLVGYHFHAPSEHLIDGEAADAELHLVHATADERLAVLGVRLVEGAENEPLAETFEEIPQEAGDSLELSGEVDPEALLPGGGEGDVYRYEGSLTTPPCSEGVLWTVFAEPAEASREQLDALTAV